MRDWYLKNREATSKRSREYYLQNKEQFKLYSTARKQAASNNRLMWKEYRLAKMLNSAKYRARQRCLNFNLTMDFLMSIASDNCPVDGLPMDWSVDENKRLQPMPRTPSIDKIVPSLGYVQGNVQIICWQYNSWKRDMSIHDMRILLSYLRKEQK